MENKIKEGQQETDLEFLANKLSEISNNIGQRIYSFIRFILDNIIALVVMFAVGLGLGFLIDYLKPKEYLNEIILVANFDSQDYLYGQVENYNSRKFIKKDSAFIHLKSMEIEPVENVFTMMNNKDYRTFETFKVLVDRGVSIDDIKKDETFLKNNKYHKLSMFTNDNESSDKVVSMFLEHLNGSEYLQDRQKVEIENTKRKINHLKNSIVQIDSMLNKLGAMELNKGREVNVNTYSDMNDVINLKDRYMKTIREDEISIIEYQKPIFESSVNLNIVKSSGLKSFKFIFPILFVFAFFFYKSFTSFMRKYSKKEQ